MSFERKNQLALNYEKLKCLMTREDQLLFIA
jgi:hypothetical protein